jgi:chromosome segregation ATPase
VPNEEIAALNDKLNKKRQGKKDLKNELSRLEGERSVLADEIGRHKKMLENKDGELRRLVNDQLGTDQKAIVELKDREIDDLSGQVKALNATLDKKKDSKQKLKSSFADSNS